MLLQTFSIHTLLQISIQKPFISKGSLPYSYIIIYDHTYAHWPYSRDQQYWRSMEGKPPPSTTPSRRSELQGPRPTPLKVRRDSHKIKKLPPPPGPPLPLFPPPPPLPPRRPVIIYTVSPKVIHADASDFMALVQRLTGNPTSSSSTSEPYSPAARLAAIEKAHVGGAAQQNSGAEDMNTIHGFDGVNVHSSSSGYGGGGGTFPAGILSPAPSALPPMSPNFLSPLSDPNLMSFLHDLSPAFHGNYTRSSSYSEMATMPNYMASPTIPNFFTNPNLIPPTPPFDPFNQFQGL